MRRPEQGFRQEEGPALLPARVLLGAPAGGGLQEPRQNRPVRGVLPTEAAHMHTLVPQPGHGSATRPRCAQIGISAPQGCGKTTLVGELEKLLTGEGLCTATVSIDDFYLRRADLLELAAASPANALLQGRGNAGTHDLALGTNTLAALQAATCATPFGSAHAVPSQTASAEPYIHGPCHMSGHPCHVYSLHTLRCHSVLHVPDGHLTDSQGQGLARMPGCSTDAPRCP